MSLDRQLAPRRISAGIPAGSDGMSECLPEKISHKSDKMSDNMT